MKKSMKECAKGSPKVMAAVIEKVKTAKSPKKKMK